MHRGSKDLGAPFAKTERVGTSVCLTTLRCISSGLRGSGRGLGSVTIDLRLPDFGH